MESERTDLSKAKEIAYRFLTYRIRTEKEIEQKLQETGFSQAIIEETKSTLRRYGLIDDLEFAKSWIRKRLREKKGGKNRFFLELRAKGVPEEIVEEALEQELGGIDQLKIALELLSRRWKYSGQYHDQKEKSKMMDYLLRRGFDRELSEEAIREFITL